MVRFQVLALNNFQAKDIWDNEEKIGYFQEETLKATLQKIFNTWYSIFWLCGLCGKRSEVNQSLGMKILDVGKIP